MAPADTSPSTRDRLLAAAERLFLEKGVDRVSVRAVNTEAGLNPGAVHYHFGSREGLVSALLERELLPLWADRLGSIAQRARGESGDGPPFEVGELVAAIVQPFEELTRTEKGRMLCHLLARSALTNRHLYSTAPWVGTAPFEVMLARALPRLSAHEVAERWHLAFTLLLEVYGRPLSRPSGAEAGPPETGTVISFVTAGLTAPAPGTGPGEG